MKFGSSIQFPTGTVEHRRAATPEPRSRVPAAAPVLQQPASHHEQREAILLRAQEEGREPVRFRLRRRQTAAAAAARGAGLLRASPGRTTAGGLLSLRRRRRRQGRALRFIDQPPLPERLPRRRRPREPVRAGAGGLRGVQGRGDHAPHAGLRQDRRGDAGHRVQDARHRPPAGAADPPHPHDGRRHRPGSIQGNDSLFEFLLLICYLNSVRLKRG